MKIELTLKIENSRPQYLGMIGDKDITIEPKQKVILSGEEWDQIKNRPWNVKLVKSGCLEIKEIDKKIKKMEKDIEEGRIDVNAG